MTFGPSMYSFENKLPIYEIILSAEGSQSINTCHASGKILKSYKQSFILIAFPRFWF